MNKNALLALRALLESGRQGPMFFSAFNTSPLDEAKMELRSTELARLHAETVKEDYNSKTVVYSEPGYVSTSVPPKLLPQSSLLSITVAGQKTGSPLL